MRSLVSLVGFAAAFYLVLCAWMYATQRSQLYFPTPAVEDVNASESWLRSEDERIRIWTVARPARRALIYFGGNGEDVAGNIDTFSAAFPDHSLYFVNYRGYGGSSGKPSEPGIVKDALAVFDEVSSDHPDVTVFGRSLGSGVALRVASERPVAKLVLVTPFDSLVAVARAHFPYLPVGLLMRDRYECAGRARDVGAPVLVIVAAHDEIIPRARSDALVAAFPASQVTVRVIDRAMHNTLDLAPEFLESVRSFLSADDAGR
jgi:pimeloyl-ACP methyl ester carboxylesterase